VRHRATPPAANPGHRDMAILKIARMGNEILKRVAEPIDDPTEPAIARLAEDMRETLEDIGANGLAAPQVHVSKRLFVYRIAARQIPPGRSSRSGSAACRSPACMARCRATRRFASRRSDSTVRRSTSRRAAFTP
jgi:hypothetical protein